MKVKLKFAILILAFCNNKGFGQGVGSHITLIMDSAIETSATTFQFGLYAVSDGDTTSDLRANSFQFGINYDTLILHTGDSIITTFLPGTSDFIPPLGAFNFPAAVSKNHIRLMEVPSTGGNTGNKMIVGKAYRVGRFQFQCGTGWVNGTNPVFTLQDSIVPGKTACLAVVWKDSSASVVGFSTLGTGDGDIGLVVNANQVLSSVNEISNKEQIEIYPNPASGNVTISYSLGASMNLSIVAFDMYGVKIKNLVDEAVSPGEHKLNWDITSLASGIYFLHINAGAQLISKKIAVIR